MGVASAMAFLCVLSCPWFSGPVFRFPKPTVREDCQLQSEAVRKSQDKWFRSF